MTLLVVGPTVVLVDGVWGNQLEAGYLADSTVTYDLGSLVIWLVVIPPIVTAMHVRVVQRLAGGVEPTVGAAIREAVGRVLPALVTVALYTVGLVIGLALLVAPGVWFGVRYYFCAQAAVVDELGPVAALRRSGQVVGAEWGRVFGYLIGSSVAIFVLIAALGVPLALIGDAIAGAPGVLVVTAFAQTAGTSVSALFGTLLFFELRASRDPLA